MKLVKCKACGHDIAVNAKRCPNCGAINAALRKRTAWAGIVVVLVVIFIAIIAASSGDASDSQPSGSGSGSNNIGVSSGNTGDLDVEPGFNVATAMCGTWEITLKGVEYKDDYSAGLWSEYVTEEGATYAGFKVVITNTAEEAKTLFPLIYYPDTDMNVKLVFGKYEYERTVMILHHDDITNKELNPLVSATGIIAFEIPDAVRDSSEPLVLRFTCGDEYTDFTIER